MNIAQYQAPKSSTQPLNISLTETKKLVKAINLLGHSCKIYANPVSLGDVKYLPVVKEPSSDNPNVDTEHTVYDLDGFTEDVPLYYDILLENRFEGDAAPLHKELVNNGDLITGLSRVLNEIDFSPSGDKVLGAISRIPGVLEAVKAALS